MAAGIGVVVAKKLGLLALILAFGKKAIVFIVAGLAAIARWFGSIFGGKKKKAAAQARALDAAPALDVFSAPPAEDAKHIAEPPDA